MNALARAWTTRIPWLTTVVVALAIGVELQPACAPALIYERTRILDGEVWRLWTGHWVHLNAAHLFWNLAVLAPAAGWAERLTPQRTRLLLTLGPGFISLVLLAFAPALGRYAGLSGVATGALALLAGVQLSTGSGTERWFWWSVLALLGLKTGVEIFVEHPLFVRWTDPEIRTVPLAHVAGAVAAGALHATRRRAWTSSRP